MNPVLSILTPTIPGREPLVSALSQKITAQAEGFPGMVEHLIFSDNRVRSIGAKRQALVDIAAGFYVAFVDDDDDIADDYVERLLEAAKSQVDVLTFRQRVIYNGDEATVEFGLNHHDHPFVPGCVIKRGPWHVCAWRRDRVEMCQFGETNYGEDLIWSQQARRRVASGLHIDAVLHTYRHDAETTAAPEPA